MRSTEYGISSDFLTAAMRDRALINQVAMRTVSIVYPNAVDVGCMSHTLDHVGDNMKTPILDKFVKYWTNLFARSGKARLE